MKRATMGLLALALTLACSSTQEDGTPPTVENGLDYCLDRPGQLPRAPDGHLPCELIPPGVSLRVRR